MDQGTIERPPEGLRALYEGDYGTAPFTVDDVLSGGRARQRRQRATLAATSVTAALTVAAIAVLSSGTLGGRAAPTLEPASPTPNASATTGPAVFRPGCAPAPDTCRAAVAAWSHEYASSAAPVTLGSTLGYEKGAVVFEQLVSSVPGERDIHLTVVVAPTEPVIDDGLDPFVGSGARSIAMTGTGETVHGIEISLGGQYVSRWKTLAVAGERAHPAVQVAFNVANQGPRGSAFDEATDEVSPPSYWTDASLRALLTALIGDVADPAKPAVRAEPAATAEVVRSPGCSLDHEKCSADTWHSWAHAELTTTLSVGDWTPLSSSLDDADVIGWAQTASASSFHGALVTLSVGDGVGRYGGLYGDALDDVGEVRNLPLPGGGTAEVHSWLGRPDRRVVYLVKGDGASRGDRRLVVTSPRFSSSSKVTAPLLPGWSEDAAISLLEAVE